MPLDYVPLRTQLVKVEPAQWRPSTLGILSLCVLFLLFLGPVFIMVAAYDILPALEIESEREISACCVQVMYFKLVQTTMSYNKVD